VRALSQPTALEAPRCRMIRREWSQQCSRCSRRHTFSEYKGTADPKQACKQKQRDNGIPCWCHSAMLCLSSQIGYESSRLLAATSRRRSHPDGSQSDTTHCSWHC
jgi:hypothetical protein